ncbi:MAG: two pore domain potassium channel family protein [Deltaproteobacteria bacterium]|nr:two pore domain potassium channel family protein [Deltaproteobacteria bacterium]
MIRKRAEEFHSFILAVLFVFSDIFIRATMLFPLGLFGLSRDNLRPKHLEIYLISTTSVIVLFILLSHFWEVAGWICLLVGTVRILQVMALNGMSLLFGLRLLSPHVPDRERTRWHFVAIFFSMFDVLLIYSFFYYFLNRRFEILNLRSESFFDYMYYAMITLMTVGYGDIVPVTPLGKFLAMSESFVGVYLLVFLVNAAMGRFQRHAE